MDSLIKKKLGAFYTDNKLVNFINDKIIKQKPNSILEPSFGDGIFIKDLISKKFNKKIVGVEIDKNTFQNFDIKQDNIKTYNKNFLNFSNQKFEAIVGNPPFVRTRFLGATQKKIAVDYYKKRLKLKSLSDPSIWLLFLYHSMNLLKKDGSICFILPYDFTFVTYGKPLWEKLFNNFKKIEVHHTKKRYFNDILQDTIVFFANQYSGKTNKVEYFAYNNEITDKYTLKSLIKKEDILGNNKPFKRALLTKKFLSIEKKISKKLINLSELASFHIGYVSGNKKYFHPNNETIEKFKLKKKSFIKTIADTSILKNCGILTSNINKKDLNNLFYPKKITNPDKEYIKFGEKNNFHKQHKTKIRDDWFKVPLIKTPDYLLSVFNEFPIMIFNDAKYIATNTFLCGYINKLRNKKILLNSWFSSLTKLYIELEIHSLGGGMLIMVPQEVGRIKIPNLESLDKFQIMKINKLANKKEIKKIIEIGDDFILKKFLNLSQIEIREIKNCIEILKFWRNPI